MPNRPVSQQVQKDWKGLADIFVKLLGGSAACQQAATYLRALANNELPTEEPPDLPWHSHEAAVEIMPQPQQEPHPVVLATLSPSVALRAVWRRPRAG